MKETTSLSGKLSKDDFLCFRHMWEPAKEDYELLFSLKQFDAVNRTGEPDDVLQFAAETSRDYLR